MIIWITKLKYFNLEIRVNPSNSFIIGWLIYLFILNNMEYVYNFIYRENAKLGWKVKDKVKFHLYPWQLIVNRRLQGQKWY